MPRAVLLQAPRWPARAAVLSLALLLALLLGGCSRQPLYSQLSEQQANEMVAALRGAGLEANKRPGDGGNFAVETSAEDFAAAVELLRAAGLPREGFDTLGKVFKREGFVSSKVEEHARLTHALSQEIANTLASIDGVVVARVHLSVPERDALSERAEPASASVFIKHRPSVELSGQVGHIKALVVNAIQGLPYDNVTVALFPADPVAVRRPAPGKTVDKLAPPLVWLAGLGTVALALGLVLWGWRRRPVPPAEPAPVQQPWPGRRQERGHG